MESLEEAHKLLDRHVQSIIKHKETEAAVHLELDEIKTENKMLKESLDKKLEEEKMMEHTLRCHKDELLQQVAFKHIFSIEGVGWGGGASVFVSLFPKLIPINQSTFQNSV